MAKNRGLSALDSALSEGKTEEARRALLALGDDERAILAEYFGDEGLKDLYRAATRRRRGPALGRVVLLPGLMGSNLDAVDASGGADRIWVNLFRIFGGRMRELQLGEDGQPLPPPPTIRATGIHSGTYLKLLFELQAHWDAIPFGYDWRADVRQSATLLAGRIREWAKGEPVHLVAHSMGGVVARTFIRMFPDAWAGMQDRKGGGRGGRLVMLGTPNRGAFAIVLALSGEEKLVKTLARIDGSHHAQELLHILNTFLGSYQMLPSPRVDLGDDHRRLFDAATWGSLPVRQGLLQQGEQYQEWLHPVIDPDRMIYVAGYGQQTPVRVRVDGPGRFSYELTEDGDGRVPHSLGLLEDVRTYWVKEKHGDLARNAAVLQAIHLLLQSGETLQLEASRPRGVGATRAGYQKPATFETVPAEVEAGIARARSRGRRPVPMSDKEAARLHAIAFADYLGHPKRSTDAESAAPRRERTAAQKPPTLAFEVVWGDITKAKADVYVAGAYARVPPAGPLRELDQAVSKGLPHGREAIAEQVSRALLTARLGDVDFFPWGRGRTVAVAGMGYAGAFREGELRRLTRNVVWAVNTIPHARSLATVLIGSGDGNLSVPVAVRGILEGLADAVGGGGVFTRIRRVSLVEYRLDRALEILTELQACLGNSSVREVVDVRLAPQVVRGEGGGVSDEQNAVVLLTAAATAAVSPRSREGRALDTLIRSARRLPRLPKLVRQNVGRAQVVAALRRLGGASPKVQLGPSPGPANPAPTRLSFFTVGDQIHSAAITDTTTVMERVLRLDPQLVGETVQRMTEPDADDVERLARLLRNLLIHEDLAGMVSGSVPLVFEVDRSMAPVHWEMMADDQGKPLALQGAVARQLRTTYSPAPLLERAPGPLRALVVGDPGDPDAGESLPGARREASIVAALLRRKGVEVIELIGAPDANGYGPIPNVAPATRLDVLDALMSGGFDILHYSGHGDFDPQQPDRVGWVFKGGLLTPGELQRVGRAPRLVVANACLSARTSFTTTSGEPPTGRLESGLAPSLADEFFRRGVQDYIGTAWPIDDAGAVLFAETLYGRLLADPGSPQQGETAGQAVLEARQELAKNVGTLGPLWAAYQHSAESEGGQMSHVPSFEHDVFVSYAHLDNESAGGRTVGGWVDVFVRRLDKQVKQRLGSKAVDFWSDPKHAGNQPLTRDILTAARDSAVLMVVMSPSVSALGVVRAGAQHLPRGSQGPSRRGTYLHRPVPGRAARRDAERLRRPHRFPVLCRR